MNRLPIRASITLLVVGAATVALALVVLAGGVTAIDEDIAVDSFESTTDALNQADQDLLRDGRELQVRIQEWSEVEQLGDEGLGEPFEDWDDVRDRLNIAVFNAQSDRVDLVWSGPIEISAYYRCRGAPDLLTCDEESLVGSSGVTPWASDQITRRVEDISSDVPAVVHGFVVVPVTGEPLLVRFESDVVGEGEITSGVEDLAFVLLPLLLVGLGAITWLSLGRALSPVKAMTDQVDAIGADSLDQRVNVPEANDELKHLATTMNRMLDRLQGASDRQRQFVSDASHELRSPITATGATLQVARSSPDSTDWDQVAAVLDEENSRLSILVDDLLLLARMDEQAHGGVGGRLWPVDLDEICLAEADRPHPVDVAVRVVEPVRVGGNTSMITRAVRNLVVNAATHAATRVQLEVDRRDGDAIIRVHDDGPGVPPEFAQRIFERFVRVDEARARDGTGGAGLGLAIARRVAENHGGRLELVQGDGSGATFELVLPAEPPTER